MSFVSLSHGVYTWILSLVQMLSSDQFCLILVLLFWRFCSLHYSLISISSCAVASSLLHRLHKTCVLWFVHWFVHQHQDTVLTLYFLQWLWLRYTYNNRQWDFIVWNIICWKFSSSFTFPFSNWKEEKWNCMHYCDETKKMLAKRCYFATQLAQFDKR